MSNEYALERTCPSCAAAVPAGQTACPRCGGFPEIESARIAMANAVNRVFGAAGARFKARPISRTALLWILALTPFLFGPPLIALAILAVTVRRDRAKLTPAQTLNFAAIVLVCLANFGVSAWADALFAQDVVRFVIAMKHAFRDWVNDLLTIRIVPGGGMPHGGGGGGSRSI